MKDFIILIVLTMIVFIYIYYHYYKLIKIELHKQKIAILRYSISKIYFSDKISRLKSSPNLYKFMADTNRSKEVDIDAYLRMMKASNKKQEKNNLSQSESPNKIFKEELMNIIASKQTSNDEKMFIHYFIDLQRYITSIKSPMNYLRVESTIRLRILALDDLVMPLFKLYAHLRIRFDKQSEEFSWKIGSYEFIATRVKDRFVQKLINEEESEKSVQSLKLFTSLNGF